MEAVSAFDGGVVEADNLRGLRNTRGNNARGAISPPTREVGDEAHAPAGGLIWSRSPKADHNERGGVRLRCVRGSGGVVSTQMSELP